MRHLLIWTLLALPLASCGKGEPSSAGTPPPPATVPVTDRGTAEEMNPLFEEKWDAFYTSKYDTGDTLVIGVIGDADSLLDPVHTTRNATDIIDLMFLRLTRTNPDFSHGRWLADSWEFSKDHMELTFKLRKDVYWHDGKPTTAHDVKFTYEKHVDPVIAWSAIKWKEDIKEVVVLDDYTVKFVFKRLYPYQLMDASVGNILPKHLLEKIPSEQWKSCDFNRNPVGNGPFKFKEWKAQQYIEIVANEKWRRGRPPLNRILFKIIPDYENLALQLKSGEVDCVEYMPPSYHKDLSKVPHLSVNVYPSRNYTYIAWNLKNPLFQSKKVRQAMTLAINRKEIIDALLFEFGDVCRGPVSPIIWGYNPNLTETPYDPQKAKQLLAEEGWKDTDGDGWLDKEGKTFEFSLKTNKGNKIREDITVIAQSQLKEIGVKVNPNILEWTIFSKDLQSKNFEAGIAGWSVGLKMEMTTIWHSRSVNDKFNYVSYSNPEFDAIDDKATMEMDREKARKMWWRAQEIIVEDQPYTFLYVPKQITYIHKRLQNVQLQTIGWTYNLEQWWVPRDQQKHK